MQDAFCPHLGAHLGHGGTVGDGCIACPFHGWKYDAEGTNVEIPYSERSTARPGCAPTRWSSATGSCMAWYHPDESVAPMWEVPTFPEFDDASRLVDGASRTSYEIDTTWQEMAENGVDSAHFRYVHNTATVPELDSYETGFPVAADAVVAEVPDAAGRRGGPHRLDLVRARACRSCPSAGSSTR